MGRPTALVSRQIPIWRDARLGPESERERREGTEKMNVKIQHCLLCYGFLSFEFISLDKGGIKILGITNKGREVLGYDSAQSMRHGGIEHDYWKEKIATRLRECGYVVEKEYPIGSGKTVDLVARKNSNTIAIEIETWKSEAVANIRKCLKAGFGTVVSVGTTAQVKNVIGKEIESAESKGQTIRVLSAQELLERGGAPFQF